MSLSGDHSAVPPERGSVGEMSSAPRHSSHAPAKVAPASAPEDPVNAPGQSTPPPSGRPAPLMVKETAGSANAAETPGVPKLMHRVSGTAPNTKGQRRTVFDQIALAGAHLKTRNRQRRANEIIKNKVFSFLMQLSLFIALFGPDIWVLMDVPTNDTLDIILCVVMALFVIEMCLMTMAQRRYLGRFFFWMDLIGAFSLMLDITVMFGNGEDVKEMNSGLSSNVVLLRAARTAKLGARAGRISRVMRLLKWLPGIKSEDDEAQGAAKMITRRLMHALSTRVSFLTILLVMIVPMFGVFNYPDADYSLASWPQAIQMHFNDADYGVNSVVADASLNRALSEYKVFYESALRNYHPFLLEVFTVDASSGAMVRVFSHDFLGTPPPDRMSNRLVATPIDYEPSPATGHTIRAIGHYDFKSPNQTEALMSILLIVAVIVAMLSAAMVLSNSVSNIVLLPLERLLERVRTLAKSIFKTVKQMGDMTNEEEQDDKKKQAPADEDDFDDTGGAFDSEAQVLERVVQKLAILSEFSAARAPVDEERMKDLGKDDVAVLNMITENQVGQQVASLGVLGDGSSEDFIGDTGQIEAFLSAVGVSLERLESWDFDPTELTGPAQLATLVYVVFMSRQNSCSRFANREVFQRFCEAAKSEYKEVPYHQWSHAVDVTHGVYRLLMLTKAEQFLTQSDRYALLISAICHDVAHPGVNNIFLVESEHELALRYNDKSPLENMHCASLFRMTASEETNVFAGLSREQHKEIRKTCIDVILHTDNIHHFSMVKDLQVFYQLNKEAIDIGWDPDSETWDEGTLAIYSAADNRRLLTQLFMHASDISNPCKPFRICSLWAYRVLEEFFMQGDQEKEMGIAVQMLNDRDKVNPAHSQIGFIEFLVAPLVQIQVQCFPSLGELGVNMVHNMGEWGNVWASEMLAKVRDGSGAPPSKEEIDKILDRVRATADRFKEIPKAANAIFIPVTLPYASLQQSGKRITGAGMPELKTRRSSVMRK